MDVRRGYGVINAYYFPKRSQLRDNLGMTLRFVVRTEWQQRESEEEAKTSDRTEKTIHIRWLYGPYLLCPQHVYLSDPSKGKRTKRESRESRDPAPEDEEEGKKKEEKRVEEIPSFLIKCIVRVHPPLDVADIAWVLKPVSRERRKLVRVKPELDAFNETVKIVHVTPQSGGDNVSVVDLAIMESWVKNRRSSTKYSLDLTVEKNAKFASASIQIQWDGAAKPDGSTTTALLLLTAVVVLLTMV